MYPKNTVTEKEQPEATEGFDKLVQDGMAQKFDAVVVDSIFRCGRTPFRLPLKHCRGRSIRLVSICSYLEDDFCSADKTAEEVAEYFSERPLIRFVQVYYNRQNHFEEGTLAIDRLNMVMRCRKIAENLVLNHKGTEL